MVLIQKRATNVALFSCTVYLTQFLFDSITIIANRYPSAPISNAALYPNENATSIIAVEPSTDAAPLIAKPQSTNSPTLFVPLGNGIPIKNPSGIIRITIISIL